MPTTVAYLVEGITAAYQEHFDILSLISPQTVETLGLTQFEAEVLLALVFAEGNDIRAQSILHGVNPERFNQAIGTLLRKRLIRLQHEGHDALFSLEPLVERLRLADIEESTKLVLRPLSQHLRLMARSAPTPIRGLARVYTTIFGREVQQREWAVLGLYVKELGLDAAVLFLLKHATDENLRNPLQELLPLARAQAKGFRPVDAPEEKEQQEFQSLVARQAWGQRMRRWQGMLQRGEDPHAVDPRQYALDMETWGKMGRPDVTTL